MPDVGFEILVGLNFTRLKTETTCTTTRRIHVAFTIYSPKRIGAILTAHFRYRSLFVLCLIVVLPVFYDYSLPHFKRYIRIGEIKGFCALNEIVILKT